MINTITMLECYFIATALFYLSVTLYTFNISRMEILQTHEKENERIFILDAAEGRKIISEARRILSSSVGRAPVFFTRLNSSLRQTDYVS